MAEEKTTLIKYESYGNSQKLYTKMNAPTQSTYIAATLLRKIQF